MWLRHSGAPKMADMEGAWLSVLDAPKDQRHRTSIGRSATWLPVSTAAWLCGSWELGLKRSAVARRVASGRLHQVHAGVYASGIAVRRARART